MSGQFILHLGAQYRDGFLGLGNALMLNAPLLDALGPLNDDEGLPDARPSWRMTAWLPSRRGNCKKSVAECGPAPCLARWIKASRFYMTGFSP